MDLWSADELRWGEYVDVARKKLALRGVGRLRRWITAVRNAFNTTCRRLSALVLD
jgi:hypothetical protein